MLFKLPCCTLARAKVALHPAGRPRGSSGGQRADDGVQPPVHRAQQEESGRRPHLVLRDGPTPPEPLHVRAARVVLSLSALHVYAGKRHVLRDTQEWRQSEHVRFRAFCIDSYTGGLESYSFILVCSNNILRLYHTKLSFGKVISFAVWYSSFNCDFFGLLTYKTKLLFQFSIYMIFNQ